MRRSCPNDHHLFGRIVSFVSNIALMDPTDVEVCSRRDRMPNETLALQVPTAFPYRPNPEFWTCKTVFECINDLCCSKALHIFDRRRTDGVLVVVYQNHPSNRNTVFPIKRRNVRKRITSRPVRQFWCGSFPRSTEKEDEERDQKLH